MAQDRPRYLAFALTACWIGHAAAEPPRFGAYPARVTARNHQPALDFLDPRSRQYAGILKSAANKPVNFAGHTVLTVWGCGASCIMAAAIDADSGAVAWLPFTVCCWPRDVTEPLEFKPDSRLLLVHGSLNEQGEGTHEYLFDGHGFTLRREPPPAEGVPPSP